MLYFMGSDYLVWYLADHVALVRKQRAKDLLKF